VANQPGRPTWPSPIVNCSWYNRFHQGGLAGFDFFCEQYLRIRTTSEYNFKYTREWERMNISVPKFTSFILVRKFLLQTLLTYYGDILKIISSVCYNLALIEDHSIDMSIYGEYEWYGYNKVWCVNRSSIFPCSINVRLSRIPAKQSTYL